MTANKKDPYFDPRCCYYRLSRKIRNHVKKLIKDDSVDQATKSVLKELMDQDESNKNRLAYDSLVELHKYILRADETYVEPFYKFSDDCKCIEPKPRENKELDERLKLLRLRSSQKMYANMTSSTTPSSGSLIDQKEVSEFKSLNGSMIAVLNSFLIFICTFIFFYKAVEYALPNPNIIAQVSCGLGGSTVVAIAELYFIARVI